MTKMQKYIDFFGIFLIKHVAENIWGLNLICLFWLSFSLYVLFFKVTEGT